MRVIARNPVFGDDGMNQFNESDCQKAADIQTSWFLFCCSCSHILLSAIAIGLVINLSLSNKLRRLLSVLSTNIRLLACCGLIIYSLGVLVPASFYFYIAMNKFLLLSDCSFIWHAYNCVMFRTSAHFSIFGLNIFHVLISIERIMMVIKTTSAERPMVGRIIAVLTFLLPVFVVYIMYGGEVKYSGLYKIYCFPTRRTMENIVTGTLIMLVFDGLSLLADCWIYRQNQKKLKSNMRFYSPLSNTFKLREINISIRMLIPLSIIHTITFMPYLLIYAINPLFEGATQMKLAEIAYLCKAIYNVIIPLTLTFLLHRKQTEVAEWQQPASQLTDSYFNQLKTQLQ
ncbi:hypothetical protein M3Y95_00910900 [Aphelenchoides besseyi]|nr:hypothetical protein M3Y95_00910900 [Aphelenchoides besseyi]